jgi:hypothetical protein
MNIEQRLTRLTERHETLSGEVEMPTADLGQRRDRIDDLSKNVEKQARTMDELTVGHWPCSPEVMNTALSGIEGR